MALAQNSQTGSTHNSQCKARLLPVPYLFTLTLEAMMNICDKNGTEGQRKYRCERIYGTKVSNLRFADDIDMVAKTNQDSQDITDAVRESNIKMGLKINAEKTKIMLSDKDNACRWTQK